MWYIVISLNDPVTPIKFDDIPVKIVNADAITREGKVFEILDGTDTIDVSISAKRSVIETIEKDNIVAVADMQELTFMDTVGIKVSTNKNNDKLNSIKSNIENLKVEIENMKKVQMVIETSTVGEAAEGYMIGEVRADQNLVQLSGPESIISLINKVLVEVDVDKVTTDIKTEAPLILYDVDGNIIENDNITASLSKIGVGVTILQKKVVPINFTITGTPSVGYGVSGNVESDLQSVTIAGKPSVLNNVAAIDIPESVLDVTGATASLVTVINVKQYLPDYVYLVDSTTNGKISVTVPIEKEIEAPLQVKRENIAIQNLPDNLEATIVEGEDSFTTLVSGLPSNVNSIGSGFVPSGVIDAGGLVSNTGVGTYLNVEVDLVLPQGIKAVRPILVSLEVKEKES